MKARALLFALAVGVVSMTSGCRCFRCCFPNAGWRLHDGEGLFSHCGASGWGGPACCAPVGAPGPAYRPPVVVSGPVAGGPVVPNPDCPGCAGGVEYPPGFPQPVAYPPIIGNPMPLPGAKGPNELHNPMPVKPGQ